MQIRQLLEARSARALDEDTSGHVLVASDLTGSFQLYEHGAELRQLTDFTEPVTGRLVPGTRKAVVQMDNGGNERHQLYLIDLEDPPLSSRDRLEDLTADPEHVYRLLGVSPDGTHIAFTSNKRNGVDFDVCALDLSTRAVTTLHEGGYAQEATGYSPNGRYLSFLLPGPRPLDIDLVLVELETGRELVPLPHPDEAAIVSGPAWVGGHSFIASSSIGRDFAALVWHDLITRSTVTVLEEEHNLECVTSADGKTLLAIANVDGASRADLFDVEETVAEPRLRPVATLPLPGRGVISSLATPPPLVGTEGLHVTYNFSSPLVPGDVWRVGRPTIVTTRLTRSPGPDPDRDGLAEPTEETVTSFDGEKIPLFCYRPRHSGREGGVPVVLVIHGGPEGQSVLSFNPVVQGFVDAGLGVVVPNVRGSTGYGKRYSSLDDTTRRLDSVADLAAVHGWLASAGFDPERAALYGGSYGGYMVLAGLAFQPELWAAGVDIVGISDLVTFLENTSAYRRAHREHEYGSLATDRDFLAAASPLRKAEEIRAPLFVVHGLNDPRVPVDEARQLTEALARRKVPHELLIFPDEGHGLAKLANRLEAYPRIVEFLVTHLRPEE